MSLHAESVLKPRTIDTEISVTLWFHMDWECIQLEC